MKNIKFVSIDMLIIILSGLLIGLVFGVMSPVNIKMRVQTFYSNLYIKFHPESQMDTQTIIINKVTKNSVLTPQNDIFEMPVKKENQIILFVKNLFKQNKQPKEKPLSIHDDYIE